MRTHDVNGRAYATVKDLKAGDKVEVDAGFTCIAKGAVLTVNSIAGELCIECRAGNHGLVGQIEGRVYIGVYPAVAS